MDVVVAKSAAADHDYDQVRGDGKVNGGDGKVNGDEAHKPEVHAEEMGDKTEKEPTP